MRLVEILSYRLKANSAPAFHKLVREQSVPLLTAWGTDVVAYGISAHEADAYYLIRAYKDRADLQQSQDRFYASAAWRSGPREEIVAKIESALGTQVWLSDAGVEDLRACNADTQRG